jgi:hypothetical protein
LKIQLGEREKEGEGGRRKEKKGEGGKGIRKREQEAGPLTERSFSELKFSKKKQIGLLDQP